ncbi:invasin domain 3-containing protein [Pontitalea aquivivens]|uniref:invasin domain 3-containing protein n=1 Tax=Pontitalea aquivivens TaxID=3388663 RepID=UPI003970FA40
MQLKDANGNNLTTGGATVALSTTLGTLGSVTDNGDGTYTATLTSSTTAGTATISGTLGGTAITDTATVAFTPGTAAVAISTITASPTSILADGTTTSTITVQLKDRRVPTVPSSKPRRNAAVNRGTTVFATHDLGSAPCGCPVGQVGAIVRFKRITSVMGPARLIRALSPASLAYLRGVPKCIRCAMTLTWNDFLKAVTKLGKMNPTL